MGQFVSGKCRVPEDVEVEFASSRKEKLQREGLI
jgi:hypothetical protein